MTLDGHVITGAVTFLTATINKHEDFSPALSYTVQLTVVLPGVKLMDGVHTIPGVLIPDSSHAETGSVVFVGPMPLRIT